MKKEMKWGVFGVRREPPKHSSDYSVPAESVDAGGQRATSTLYTNDGSHGGIVGISTCASSAQSAKARATGALGLTALGRIPDNYGSYADDWQFDHFGLDNPLVGHLLDPDCDGQNNAFEFTAGLIPTDRLSRFSLSVARVPGQPTQRKVIFDPIVPGSTSKVMTSPDLTPGSWVPLSEGSISNDGDQPTVTDPAASATK